MVAEGRAQEAVGGEQQAVQPVPLREHRHGRREQLRLAPELHRFERGRHRCSAGAVVPHTAGAQRRCGDGRGVPQLRVLLRLHRDARTAGGSVDRHEHGQDLGACGILAALRHLLHPSEEGEWRREHGGGDAVCGGVHGGQVADHDDGAHEQLACGGLVQAAQGQGRERRGGVLRVCLQGGERAELRRLLRGARPVRSGAAGLAERRLEEPGRVVADGGPGRDDLRHGADAFQGG